MFTVAEMYIHGVSSRRVEAVFQAMGIDNFSAEQVSNAPKISPCLRSLSPPCFAEGKSVSDKSLIRVVEIYFPQRRRGTVNCVAVRREVGRETLNGQ